jgi:hypothetical protein
MSESSAGTNAWRVGGVDVPMESTIHKRFKQSEGGVAGSMRRSNGSPSQVQQPQRSAGSHWRPPGLGSDGVTSTHAGRARFDSHVIDASIGNSEKVCRDHSLLVTDADYQTAVSGAGEIPAHSPLISSHQEPSTRSGAREKRLHSLEDEDLKTQKTKYPRQGENKPGFTREKRKGRGAPGTQSGTRPVSGRRSRKGGAR